MLQASLGILNGWVTDADEKVEIAARMFLTHIKLTFRDFAVAFPFLVTDRIVTEGDLVFLQRSLSAHQD